MMLSGGPISGRVLREKKSHESFYICPINKNLKQSVMLSFRPFLFVVVFLYLKKKVKTITIFEERLNFFMFYQSLSKSHNAENVN